MSLKVIAVSVGLIGYAWQNPEVCFWPDFIFKQWCNVIKRDYLQRFLLPLLFLSKVGPGMVQERGDVAHLQSLYYQPLPLAER